MTRSPIDILLQLPVAVGVFIGDQYRIEYANDKALEIWGKERDDVMQKPVFEIFPELLEQGFDKILTDVVKGKRFEANEEAVDLIRNGKKERLYLNFSYDPYYDENGTAIGFIGTGVDVTELVNARKETHDAYRELSLRSAVLEALNEATPDGLLVVDTKGKILLNNRRFAELWKIPYDILKQKNDNMALDHAASLLVDAKGFRERISYIYKNVKDRSYDTILLKDSRVIERHGVPVRAENGIAYGWAWYFRDITDRIKQEQKFKNVVEQASDPILILKGEDMVLEVANQALLNLWSVDRSAIGKAFLDILPEMREQGFLQLLQGVYHTGKPFHGVEVPAVFKSGGKERTVYFHFTYQPYRESDGSITGVLVTASDVTGQVLAKQKLVQSERNFRDMVEQAPVAMLVAKGDSMVFETVNEPMLQLLNKTSDIIGKPVLEVFPEVENQAILEIAQGVYQTGEPYYGTEMLVPLLRDGILEDRYFNFFYTPLKQGEEIIGIMEVAIEVTENVKLRRSIEESEAYFRRIADTAPSALWITETDGSCSYLNAEWYAQTGQSKEDSLGYGWLNAVHPEDKPKAEQAFLESNRTQSEFYVQYRLRLKTGEYHWVIDTGRPRYNENGDFAGYVGTIVPIHRQKLAEEAVQQREEQLRIAIEGGELGTYDYRPQFGTLVWSDKTKELFGLPPDADVSYDTYLQGLHPDDRENSDALVRKAMYEDGSRKFEHEYRTIGIKDGRLRWIRAVGTAFVDENSSAIGLIGVVQDITKRKEIELSLAESQKRWKELANAVPAFVWTAGKDGALDFLNDHWYDYTGLTEAESLGFGWTQVLHSDDVDRCLAVWNNAREKEVFYEVEVRYRSKEGHYRWVIGRGKPIRNEENELVAWYGTSTDIHEQKMFTEQLENLVAERTRELELSNEGLQRFAYSASHDLQEPLRKVNFFIERLQENLGESLDTQNEAIITKIRQSTGRMKALINDLLDYSHITFGATKFSKIDLNELIKDILNDFELNIAEKNAVIRIDVMAELHGDERQLRQLIQNLLSNALKYSRPDAAPEILIQLTNIEGQEAGITLPIDAANRKFNRLVVQDNGIGFPQKDAEKIFEPFQRLHGKGEYSGTGIGLAIVKKAVENHNGLVWAESKAEHGTKVTVLLPSNL